MWIMLIKKLPIRPSPAKLSIFWAVPWPDEHQVALQQKQYFDEALGKWSIGWGYEFDRAEPPQDYFFDDFGKEPNAANAVRIRYKGHDLRVWPHEYSILSPENMAEYVRESHELVADEVSENRWLGKIIERDTESQQFNVYEAALLDGCTVAEATLTAMEMDITIPDPQFPPAIGWYRCKPHYAEIYCYEWEMIEDGAERDPEADCIPET